MHKKTKTIIISFAVFLSVLFLGINPVYAHYPSNPGSETEGYIVDIWNHAGTSVVNYGLDSNITTSYKNFILDGAQKWKNTGVITFNYATSFRTGSFLRYTDSSSDTVAAFYDYQSSNYHLYHWKIKLNTHHMDGRGSTANATTVAHELGHATGLNDLYSFANTGKLMYGYSSRTVTYPVASDISGAKVANH
ncbi:hypothetical protein [Metabacillus sp. FJAT-52054]|uniref:Peptidase M10 metallopeptidase domain-containing protein n=1 Tax=Metabacillus sediminis TaxID=3117746 RepID=A0ABZ2NG77_9BACI